MNEKDFDIDIDFDMDVDIDPDEAWKVFDEKDVPEGALRLFASIDALNTMNVPLALPIRKAAVLDLTDAPMRFVSHFEGEKLVVAVYARDAEHPAGRYEGTDWTGLPVEPKLFCMGRGNMLTFLKAFSCISQYIMDNGLEGETARCSDASGGLYLKQENGKAVGEFVQGRTRPDLCCVDGLAMRPSRPYGDE